MDISQCIDIYPVLDECISVNVSITRPRPGSYGVRCSIRGESGVEDEKAVRGGRGLTLSLFRCVVWTRWSRKALYMSV